MYSQQELDDAVAAGAINREAANSLRAFVAAQRSAPAVDEEHFRLITGFNDIFVALASIILLVAVGWIGQAIGQGLNFALPGGGPSPLAGAAVAAAAWGLATYFTAKRRMALPSILLMLAFVGGTFWAVGSLLAVIVAASIAEPSEQIGGFLAALAAAITAGAAWLHWKTFRVPITVAAGAAAVAGIVAGITAGVLAGSIGDEALKTVMLTVVLLLGLGIFAYAMRWDMSDPGRVTRRSDVAFWLHLLAAPMIVHPVFTLLGLNDGHATIGEGLLVIALYIALGIAALAIDRRALLVSGLAYVIWALSDMFEQFGAIELNIALTALVIGSALLLLSAFWHQARSSIIARLPEGWQARLPHPSRLAVAEASPEPSA
ncbi:hypothetical protein [Sphingomicrobium lutaoense]|uniref:Putative membrane protein YfcA n=1 Tax=Sphingomicrobium lutaoense TaxID=515949 RepID=A0A839Z636_9SPHN|nr:hypothetical protein [Sphingomicrobium lutaoense]MBB3764164.1 putative membrane protein YfcA [Sphingomicrobium lutaoense]